MPTDPRPDDQSLLDRLNALKPTAVTLGKSPNTAVLLPGPAAQPVSREDALAERLRVLRTQSSSSNRDDGLSRGDSSRAQPSTRPGRDEVGTAAPPSVEPPVVGSTSPGRIVSRSTSVPQEGRRLVNQKPASYRFAESEADDENALDELLEALGDEDFDLATEEDLESPFTVDPSHETEKTHSLLDSLGKGTGHTGSKENILAEDDDDSDGEQMTREVEKLLSQIGDEINALPPPATVPAEDLNHRPPEAEPEAGPGPASKPVERDGDDDSSSLALPAVPSKLVDPVPHMKLEDEFEKEISARMASLRGLGPVDELGLPSVPTFRPQDHTPATSLGKRLLRSSKYTDEDQRTWCIACLDDATIRCAGCDNDVYCARCWAQMHVGPSAGNDERRHLWAKIDRTAHP